MAGHSKWANIKHRKAAADAKKGKVYTKLAREIESAARLGGGDLEVNYNLRLVVDKAKKLNMPNDNIDRAIKRGTGELQGDALEEIFYEGYGPNGTAMIFKCLTDNKNRTVGDLRFTLRKANGSLAESGAVAWQFESKGMILLPVGDHDPEELMLMAIDAGAEDVEPDDEMLEIVTARTDLQKVAEALRAQNLEVESEDLTMIPKHLVDLALEEELQVMSLIENLEELDDVQEIYTNVHFSEQAMAQAEA